MDSYDYLFASCSTVLVIELSSEVVKRDREMDEEVNEEVKRDRATDEDMDQVKRDREVDRDG